MTIVVTGHGRSGTQWLAGVLSGVGLEAYHESDEIKGDVVVSCRFADRLASLAPIEEHGHRVVHLVRDGRDVIRSTHSFFGGKPTFTELCARWDTIVRRCEGFPVIRFEDLLKPRNATVAGTHTLPHWTEWSAHQTDVFWAICGETMRRYGYER